MKKTLLVLLLALVLALTFAACDGQDIVEDQGLKFISNKDGTCYVRGTGNYTDTKIVIPEVSPKGDTVIGIDREAFHYCGNLTSIEIPDSVTSIGASAFDGCKSLANVSFGEGIQLTKIEERVFGSCSSLEDIKIPVNVTVIDKRAFSGCSSLSSIEIPDNVTAIGDSAFGFCSSLKSVVFGENSQLFVLVGNSAFYGCPIEYAEIPAIAAPHINNDSLKTVVITSGDSIGDSAFSDCSNLTSVVIPDGVTNIGSSAFSDCSNLTSVVIPDSVTTIGNYAFLGCSSLTSLKIPDSVTSIGDSAFFNCLIEHATIPAMAISSMPYSTVKTVIITSGTSINHMAFLLFDNLTSIQISDSVTSIDGNAFEDCANLTNIVFGENSQLTSIGDKAFSGCSSLASIEIPNSVTTIGSYAFYNCDSLTSIAIPDSVTTIGECAFSDCNNIASVIFSDSGRLTNIGDAAFHDCSSIESIEIPNSVVSIGRGAFSGCYSLASVVFGENSQLISMGGQVFSDCSSLTSIVIPGLVTNISEKSFSGCSSLASIEIHDEVTNIGGSAFYGCSRLTSIKLPASLTSIGWHAFSGCNMLAEVINKSSLDITTNIPQNTTVEYFGDVANRAIEVHNGSSRIVNVDDYLFYTYKGVHYLIGYVGTNTELTLPESYEGDYYEIYKYAFYRNNNITSITIPDSVTGIGYYAFVGCNNLTNITVSRNNTMYLSIDGTLYDKRATTLIRYAIGKTEEMFTIPDIVTNIGDCAFSDCSSITSIVIPNSVTSIGESAFSSCSSLASIMIPDSVTSIGERAFFGCHSLTIYCESAERPSGWNRSWNSSNRPVVWGYKA